MISIHDIQRIQINLRVAFVISFIPALEAASFYISNTISTKY